MIKKKVRTKSRYDLNKLREGNSFNRPRPWPQPPRLRNPTFD